MIGQITDEMSTPPKNTLKAVTDECILLFRLAPACENK